MLKPSQIRELNDYSPREGLGTLLAATKNVMCFTYDFNRDGGSILAPIIMRDQNGDLAKVPANAIITRSYVSAREPLQSSGAATCKMDVHLAGDVVADDGYADFMGVVEGIQEGSAAQMLRVPADSYVRMFVSGANLTGGRLNLFLEFVLDE